MCPDIYQGNEIWDFSLVDPDNRRPVDYEKRQRMLESLGQANPEELLGCWRDGRIKLFLTQCLLTFRREHRDLFARGRYRAFDLTGEFADCVIAFARILGKSIDHRVVAPRLSSRIGFAARRRTLARHRGAVPGRN